MYELMKSIVSVIEELTDLNSRRSEIISRSVQGESSLDPQEVERMNKSIQSDGRRIEVLSWTIEELNKLS